MKIRILSVIILSYFLNLKTYAQSFEIAGGDSLLYSSNLNPVSPPGAHMYIRNISGSLKTVKVLREIISKPAGHVTYFCWGPSCYGPNTNESPDIIPLAETEADSSFKGYVNPNGVEGTTVVRYCFQNAELPSDQICVTLKHNFSTSSVGSSNAPSERVTAIQAVYDPYNQTIHVDVNGGKIEVMNMLGQQVPLNFRYDGNGMTADASSLKTGYYFLFGKNEKGPWTARVVVSKS